MTYAADRIPFSETAGLRYVTQSLGDLEPASKRVISALVHEGFQEASATKSFNAEEDWVKSLDTLVAKWRESGDAYPARLLDEETRNYAVEPEFPPSKRALHSLGICPLWPFCQ